MSAPDEPHYAAVVDAIFDGRLVPLLGAGVNQYGRSSETPFQLGRDLPNGGELCDRPFAQVAGERTGRKQTLLLLNSRGILRTERTHMVPPQPLRPSSQRACHPHAELEWFWIGRKGR
jgi:hypothetical protein